MDYQGLKKVKLPDSPGVYEFIDAKGKILYIGRATSLRDRVRSYFSNDILKTRGLHISNMVTLSKRVNFIPTGSVLEALILESRLIKKFSPHYNTKEKDDKSFNCVVITKEEYPRVIIVRAREVEQEKLKKTSLAIFGPFPQGTILREAMRIVRKIFPYRDKCRPNQGRPCFEKQLGLCPGVCTGEISKADYRKIIKNIKLFFEGGKKIIIRSLEKEMKFLAKDFQFEKAGEVKRRIFALTHIKDISLIKDNDNETQKDNLTFRIEAYDVAHLSGKNRVASMVVVENNLAIKNDYRKFKLSREINNDTDGLKEVLERRLKHSEWRLPDLIVVDGGAQQRNITLSILKERKINIPVVSVVKNSQHKPERLDGDKALVDKWGRAILLSNAEAHRFAISYHKLLRRRPLKVKQNKP